MESTVARTLVGAFLVLVWQELWIDEHGKVTSSRLTNASGAAQRIVKDVGKSVENMRFMPGLLDGKPVAMRYVEPAFDSDP